MQQNMPTQQYRGRPCGVVLMSFLLLIQGVFMLFSGLFGLLGFVVLIFDISKGGALLAHGLISFILGVLSIVLSIGMFALARWAFWATVFVALFNLITSVTILVQTSFVSWGQIFSVAISLVILLYFLLDANVRAAFRTG